MQVFAEHVQKALHGRNVHIAFRAIDHYADRGKAHTAAGSSAGAFTRSFANRSSGRSGIALKLTPVASRMALRIAGAGPSCGSSPMPLAPNAPCWKGISSKK